jgi:Ca2+-binding RTX toxin-like protein
MLGGDGSDLIAGMKDGDTLDGGAGDDTVTGNDGNDWLRGSAGRDRMDGGTGNDTLDGGDGADLVNGDVGDDLLRAQGGAGDQLRGGVGADTLDAASGDGGGSLLLGGPDDDVYLIDSRRDEVIEVPGGGIDVVHAVLDGGSYALPAQVEHLFLVGAARTALGNHLPNRITGNAGANLLFGGGGADTLVGGLGDDSLAGGAGADWFLIAASEGADSIADFTPGEDRLILPRSMFPGLGDVLRALSDSNLGAHLAIGTGSVTFIGVTAQSIGGSDILLG